MKRRILFQLALLVGLFGAGEEARASTDIEDISISGNGARVVVTESSSGDHSRPFRIYDAYSHRQLGRIPRARRVNSTRHSDEKPHFNYTPLLSVENVSSDGRHLLIGLSIDETSLVPSYRAAATALDSLEAWDITHTPRLMWRRKGVHFLDARWVGKRITVLLQNEVQQWNERGKILNRVPLPKSSDISTLSPNGTHAILDTKPPTFTEARTGRIIQKLKLQAPERQYPLEFVVGRKSLYVWGHIELSDEPFAPWDDYYFWRVSDGKRFEAGQNAYVFSPDGTAVWDERVRRFRSIATNNITPLPVPALFATTGTYLQAVSNDGRVWIGLDGHAKLIWTTTGKTKR